MKRNGENKKSSYDHAKAHLGDAFPKSLPMEQAYVHIGMYLGWIIDNDLYSDYFGEEGPTAIFRFKRREVSCTILSELWDGDLDYEFFSATGNHFTLFYYTSGLYRQDYEDILGRDVPGIYHVADTWPNYEKLKTRIDVRYREWLKLKLLLRDVGPKACTEVSHEPATV